MVKIGHARISENNSIDGIKGDQTKKEVCITDYIYDNWIAVYRPKSTKAAETIARKCEEACRNDNIGYSQYSRYSLFNEVCNNNYNIKDLKKPCNCDCSSLVMVCCRAANITVPKAMYTYSMDNDLMKTGNFEKLTNVKYRSISRYLKRGDILLKAGHTAIVLSDGDGATSGDKDIINSSQMARHYSGRLSGKKITTGDVNIRDGAGRSFKSFGVIKKGTTIRNYGYYNNASDGTMWLLCVYTTNTKIITGYVSARYLK